jgi:hypothetical protein
MSSTILRRSRGVLVTAVSWALLWLPVGLLDVLIERAPPECLYCPSNWWVLFLGIWSLTGAVSGAAFAVVLMIAERRHSLAELSMLRIATWGAIGAAVVPVAFLAMALAEYGLEDVAWVRTALVIGLAAGLGAVCAIGTLALARRGQASSLAA